MNRDEQPVNLADVHADDAMVEEATRTYYARYTGEPIHDLLMAWREDTWTDADQELVDTRAAQRAIRRGQRRRALRRAAHWLVVPALGALALVLFLVLAGCLDPQRTDPVGITPDPGNPQPLPSVASVTDVMPDYDPAYFGGSRWAGSSDDTYGTRCSTRGIVLAEHALASGNAPADLDADDCQDDADFRDLYTGETVTPLTEDAEVDHVLAQADAWRMGAWRWDRERLWAFRNDQANLRATFGSVNGAKSDRPPGFARDEWVPSDPDARCAYGRIYQATAQRWQLELPPKQRAGLDAVLATCG